MKIIECAANDNVIMSMKAEGNADSVSMTFVFKHSNQGKVSKYEMKLKRLDAEESSGIPVGDMTIDDESSK